jgi:YhcN/YlaJ family sporulation lipoprotein
LRRPRILVLVITLIMGFSLLIGGCATSQKPAEKPAPGPTNPKVTTPAPDSSQQVARRVVTAAEAEKGVRDATAVVAGKTIYIGLDLNANLDKSTSAQVERNVLNRIKKMQPNYAISIASDIDTVTRLKNISDGIAQGKPLSSFKNELEDIGTRMRPRVKSNL